MSNINDQRTRRGAKEKSEPNQDNMSISEPEALPTFEQFYTKYYPVVLGYLRKKTNQREDAEDLTGKVFLYTYEKWSTYDSKKASLATWLFMIVHSRWIDYIRNHRIDTPIDEAMGLRFSADNPMEDAVYLESIRQDLAVALGNLPEKQRTAIILRFFGNYEDAEIATLLDTTQINVRVLIHRGIQRMRANPRIAEVLKDM